MASSKRITVVVEARVDVCQLASILRFVEETGMTVGSRSELVNIAISLAADSLPKHFTFNDPADALDYLVSNIRIATSSRTIRHLTSSLRRMTQEEMNATTPPLVTKEDVIKAIREQLALGLITKEQADEAIASVLESTLE